MELQIDNIQIRTRGRLSLSCVERRKNFLCADQQEREISVTKIKSPWSHPLYSNTTTNGQQLFYKPMFFFYLSGHQSVFPLAGPCDTKPQDFVIMSGPIFSLRFRTPLGDKSYYRGGRFPQSPLLTANRKAHPPWSVLSAAETSVQSIL